MPASNFETFCNEFDKNYRAAVAANPSAYYIRDSIEAALDRSKKAIAAGTMSKDGDAFKATLKALKIKNTWLAIDAYLGPIEQRGAGQ